MSSSADFLLDAVLSEALELPSSIRPEYLRKKLHDRPELVEKGLQLLEGLENDAPTSFLDQPPIIENMEDLWGAMGEPQPAFNPGDIIQSYKIINLLDEGGMGEVYLAEKDFGHFERKAAIKVVRSELVTPEVRLRFKHEQQILAKLQHPNIATLYDVNVTDDGAPFLAMEYIEGKHIDLYCDKKTLSIEERLKLFKTVCDAVQYAQDNMVVHRDLKPSNILVTRKGIVKLLDFGIAKLLDPNAEPAAPSVNGMHTNGMHTNGMHTNGLLPNGPFTNGQASNGISKKGKQINGIQANITQHRAPFTPAYAAPEQVKGKQVNAATDVFSLGIILFELLTGLRPKRQGSIKGEQTRQDTTTTANFNKPSRQLTRLKTEVDVEERSKISKERGCNKLHQLRRQLAGDLDAIVVKALEENRENRYTSAGELGRDIQRFLDRRPIQARPQSLGYRSTKFMHRYHRTVIASAIGLLILIGGITSTVKQASLKESEIKAKQSVITVISNILGKADPDQKGGYSFTTKQLIEAGLSEFPNIESQPIVHAEIMNEFGKIALNAGLISLADSLHNHALVIQRTLLGPTHFDLAETHTRIAEVYERKGDPTKAKEHFVKAIEIRPDYDVAHNNLAMFFLEQGNFVEAAQELYLAYKSAPEKAMYLRNSAGIYFMLEDWEEAKRLYTEALEKEPHFNAYSGLATIRYYVDRDYAAAAQLYRDALKLNANRYDTWGSLASALFAEDESSEEAKKAINQAIALAHEHLEKLDADDTEVHASLAGYYGRLGKNTKAYFHIEKSLQQPDLVAEVIFNIGYAYEIIGERDLAIQFVSQALNMGYPEIYIRNEPALEALQPNIFADDLILTGK